MTLTASENSLGTFLIEARGARKRLEVTRAGGPESPHLSRIERGERLPNVQTLKWLCDFYGVSFDEALHLLQAARLERDLAAVAD